MKVLNVSCDGIEVEGRDILMDIPEVPHGLGQVSENTKDLVQALLANGPIPTSEPVLTDAAERRQQLRQRLRDLEEQGEDEYVREHGVDPDDAPEPTVKAFKDAYKAEIRMLKADSRIPNGQGTRISANGAEMQSRDRANILAEIWASGGGCFPAVEEGSVMVPAYMTEVGKPRGRMRTLSKASDLDAWLGDTGFLASDRGRNRKWTTPDDRTLSWLFSNLCKHAKEVSGIAKDPHYPAMPHKFYTCPMNENSTEEQVKRGLDRLKELAGTMHSFSKPDVDKYNFTAYLMTPFWGAGARKRPLFIFSSPDGPGAGKTAAACAGACLLTDRRGTFYSEVSNQTKKTEWEAEIANRMRSGVDLRIIGLDNLRPNGVFFDTGLASQLTADDITMRAKFGRGMPKAANTFTVFITLNEDPRMSGEIASRGVEIPIKKNETPGRNWDDEREEFCLEHGDDMRAAILWALKQADGHTSDKDKVPYFRYPQWDDHVLYAAVRYVWNESEAKFVEVLQQSAERRNTSDAADEIVGRIGQAIDKMLGRSRWGNRDWWRDKVLFLPSYVVKIAALEAGYQRGHEANYHAGEFLEAVKRGKAGRFRHSESTKKIPKGKKYLEQSCDGQQLVDGKKDVPQINGFLYFGPDARNTNAITLCSPTKAEHLTMHKEEDAIAEVEDGGMFGFRWLKALELRAGIPESCWTPAAESGTDDQAVKSVSDTTTTVVESESKEIDWAGRWAGVSGKADDGKRGGNHAMNKKVRELIERRKAEEAKMRADAGLPTHGTAVKPVYPWAPRPKDDQGRIVYTSGKGE